MSLVFDSSPKTTARKPVCLPQLRTTERTPIRPDGLSWCIREEIHRHGLPPSSTLIVPAQLTDGSWSRPSSSGRRLAIMPATPALLTASQADTRSAIDLFRGTPAEADWSDRGAFCSPKLWRTNEPPRRFSGLLAKANDLPSYSPRLPSG